MIAAPRRGLGPFAAHHPPHTRARAHVRVRGGGVQTTPRSLAPTPFLRSCLPRRGLPPVCCRTPTEGGRSGRARLTARPYRGRAPTRPRPRGVFAHRAHADGDTEWVKVDDGLCLDENRKRITNVAAQNVGAKGAAGEAKCRAACEQRRPRCVGVGYGPGYDTANGYCVLYGSKLTGDDKDAVFNYFYSGYGTDRITRVEDVGAGYVCSVIPSASPPGKPPARTPRSALPQRAARPARSKRMGWCVGVLAR